jgi:hypothetical protein
MVRAVQQGVRVRQGGLRGAERNASQPKHCPRWVVRLRAPRGGRPASNLAARDRPICSFGELTFND